MAEGHEKGLGQVIIAMKGHPATGKTSLARSIASSLQIPLIDKDDIRDCTANIQQSLHPRCAAALLNSLAYDVVWKIASTQLRLGLSVIIDSPLSRKIHFDRLVELASSTGARLLIVECRPEDEDEWRRRLERRGEGDDASWHKPATWRDLKLLLDEYGGCTDYEVGDVPKLVVDTTAVGAAEVVALVTEFIHSTVYS